MLKSDALHVIIPFMPENERILEQSMGRSARQGQPGTVSLYVSRGDCFFSTPKFQKNYEKLLELQSKFSQHIREKWPWMYKYDGKYNIFKSEYPLGATPYGVLKRMSREFALCMPSCGALDYVKSEEILTDSMLRMVLVPWGVFFTDLSKNIDEYDDPHDLEVEYQDFLSELHE